MDWREFEVEALKAMRAHFNTFLEKGTKDHMTRLGHPKKFDLVSSDGKYVGDAKYLTLVDGKRYPPAKMMEITGHVWLLEKVPEATHRFLAINEKCPRHGSKSMEIYRGASISIS